jgi:hypothetical protein
VYPPVAFTPLDTSELLKLKPTKSPDPTITGLPPSFADPDLLLLELEELLDAFTVVVPPAVMFVLPPSFGVSTVGDDSVFPPEFEATAPDPGLLENVKEDFGNVVGDVWIGDDILMLIPGGLVEALLILLFPPRMLLLLFPFELLFNDNDNLYGVEFDVEVVEFELDGELDSELDFVSTVGVDAIAFKEPPNILVVPEAISAIAASEFNIPNVFITCP